MTVRDLIEALSGTDPDAEVLISFTEDPATCEDPETITDAEIGAVHYDRDEHVVRIEEVS